MNTTQGCGESVKLDEMKDHKYNSCTRRIVHCRNEGCDKKVSGVWTRAKRARPIILTPRRGFEDNSWRSTSCAIT